MSQSTLLTTFAHGPEGDGGKEEESAQMMEVPAPCKPWICHVKPISQKRPPCLYKQLFASIPELTVKQFEEKIAVIPNFTPLALPDVEDEMCESTLLATAIETKNFALATHLLEKFGSELVYIEDKDFGLSPLGELLARIVLSVSTGHTEIRLLKLMLKVAPCCVNMFSDSDLHSALRTFVRDVAATQEMEWRNLLSANLPRRLKLIVAATLLVKADAKIVPHFFPEPFFRDAHWNSAMQKVVCATLEKLNVLPTVLNPLIIDYAEDIWTKLLSPEYPQFQSWPEVTTRRATDFLTLVLENVYNTPLADWTKDWREKFKIEEYSKRVFLGTKTKKRKRIK